MASSQLTFGVLGAVEVYRDGTRLTLASARQRAVLAALLVHNGHPVSADALVEAAWENSLPANPRAALHTVLSRLRTTLEADVVGNEPAGYRLAAARDTLDATRFENLHARARDAPADRAVELLDNALALWRGRAYADFDDRDFAAAEAVRLNELRLTCFEDLAESRIDLGDAGTAAASLEAFVAEHPLRERARELLMTACYRAGRVTEALDSYRDYRTMLVDEFGLEPSPALRDLHQRILDHGVAGAARPATAVPAAPRWLETGTAVLGREDDQATLADLATEHRLVTVTGPGGVGKTTLVAETLDTLARRAGLPAFVVELAGEDDGGVDTAIAAALGVGPATGDIRDAVLDYLDVVPVLLVLDNCEHVLDGVRPFIQAALRRSPGLRIVATSRQRIGLTAEQVLPLEPLLTPGSDTTAADLTPAFRLFADRARRVRPSFTLSDAEIAAATEICRRLDGLPLAIELAATRAATLGVEPLRQRLDTGLDLLRDGGPGERSLRLTLEWSYDLLDETDRRLFAALAVFEGGFDLGDAEQVLAGLIDRPIPDGLARLMDASLVSAANEAGTAHYRLLQIVRAFAQERLTEAGAEPEIRAAHARWLSAAARAAADTASGIGRGSRSVRAYVIAANAQAAVDWALREGQSELAVDIAEVLMLYSTARWEQRPDVMEVVRRIAQHPAVQYSPVADRAAAAASVSATLTGDLETGERLARAALDDAADADERCLALLALGIGTLYRGDHDRSRLAWNQLLALPGLAPARYVNGYASLALIACYDGHLTEARRHAAAAATTAEAAGAEAARAFAAYVTAEVAAAEDLTSAIPPLETAVREAERSGVDFTAGLATTALLAALTRLGRRSDALGLVSPLLERWLRLALWPQLWTTLRILGELLTYSGRAEEAVLLLSAADRAPSAPAIAGTDTARYARLTEELRRRVDPKTHEKITALAAILPRTAVVERARAAVTELQSQPDRPAAT